MTLPGKAAGLPNSLHGLLEAQSVHLNFQEFQRLAAFSSTIKIQHFLQQQRAVLTDLPFPSLPWMCFLPYAPPQPYIFCPEGAGFLCSAAFFFFFCHRALISKTFFAKATAGTPPQTAPLLITAWKQETMLAFLNELQSLQMQLLSKGVGGRCSLPPLHLPSTGHGD